MDFWRRLDALRARWDVLRHPFYGRLSRGELQADGVAFFASQYRHAVIAVARAAEAAARVAPDVALWDELETDALVERRDVELWDRFVAVAGGDPSTTPTAGVRDCVTTWSPPRDRPLLRTLVSLYVVDAVEPAVAATTRDALARWYELRSSCATAYFDVHERRVDHAEGWRDIVAWARKPEQDEALLDEAERALRARWTLMDGVVAA